MNLTPEKGPWPRLLAFPLLSVLVGGLSLARLRPDLAYRLAHCPLRDATGIPCLTCGGTHAVVSMMQGNLKASLAANPLVFTGILVFLIWALYAVVATIFPRFRYSLELRPHEKRATRILAALVLLGTWFWLLRPI